MTPINVFVVGPVGAGKTVFSFMLNHFIQNSDYKEKVEIRVADWSTKNYFASIEKTLSEKDWPPGGIFGKYTTLVWDWKYYGSAAHFELIDPCGEDIEKELRGDSDELGILNKIKNADVLFIILDLAQHNLDDTTRRAQNAWIVENSLKNAKNASRIVLGVSKADTLVHLLPVESWQKKADVIKLISDQVPEFNISGYLSVLNSRKVDAVLFSSVFETESLLCGNKLIRVPSLPLKSKGLDIFVKAVTKSVPKKILVNKMHILKGFLFGLIQKPRNLFIFAISVFFYFLIWYILSN